MESLLLAFIISDLQYPSPTGTSRSDCTSVVCDANHHKRSADALLCELGCDPVFGAECTACPTGPTQCISVSCREGYFNWNNDTGDGCEGRCAELDGATCTDCNGSAPTQCKALECENGLTARPLLGPY